MNRLVLIGNGFDLAHGLKTSYADFIDWYYDKRIKEMCCAYDKVSNDDLCSFKYLGEGFLFTYFYGNPIPDQESGFGKELFEYLIQNTVEFEHTMSPLFERVRQGVTSKTWGGIEQDYYDLLKEYAFRDPNVNPKEPPIKALNQQLRYLQHVLVEYLTEVEKNEVQVIPSILKAIYAPIREEDMSLHGVECLKEHKTFWEKQKDDGPIEEKIDKFGWIILEQCVEFSNGKRLPNVILILMRSICQMI